MLKCRFALLALCSGLIESFLTRNDINGLFGVPYRAASVPPNTDIRLFSTGASISPPTVHKNLLLTITNCAYAWSWLFQSSRFHYLIPDVSPCQYLDISGTSSTQPMHVVYTIFTWFLQKFREKSRIIAGVGIEPTIAALWGQSLTTWRTRNIAHRCVKELNLRASTTYRDLRPIYIHIYAVRPNQQR